MEFILISESKLKIMITKNDLKEFDLCTEDLDYSNSETKRIFWDIIHRAKKSVGFVCDRSKLLVQLYSSRDGGCEMFVSRLDVQSADTEDRSELLSLDCVSCRDEYEDPDTDAFAFDSLEWLLSVCRRLKDLDYTRKSSVYLGDDGRFYLLLEGVDASSAKLNKYTFINEYGSLESTETVMHFIGEHGKTICEKDAINILSKL